MGTIVLIACCAKKLQTRAKAEHLYRSELFRRSLSYARRMQPAPTAIFVLSAKYGLVRLSDELEPYDLALKRMPSGDVRAWSEQVFARLAEWCNPNDDHFVFFAGQRYRQFLESRLCHAEVPMKGLGIGEQ